MKNQHIFRSCPHIMGKSNRKGENGMEEKREYADVDDYIFADQEWQPSEK